MSSKSVMIFVRALFLEGGGGLRRDLVPLRIGFVRVLKNVTEQSRIVRRRYDRFANAIEVLGKVDVAADGSRAQQNSLLNATNEG